MGMLGNPHHQRRLEKTHMNFYMPQDTYNDLIADLAQSFTAAANSTGTDLSDQLKIALGMSGIMPETCRDEREESVLEMLNHITGQNKADAAHLAKALNRPAPSGTITIDLETGDLKHDE
jgi:hypothetical protein